VCCEIQITFQSAKHFAKDFAKRFAKDYAKRFAKDLAKRFAKRGLKCNLNFPTHGARRTFCKTFCKLVFSIFADKHKC
jgi:DNA primase